MKELFLESYFIWFLVAKELSFCLMRVCNKALQMNPYDSFSGILMWEGKICNWVCYAFCIFASIFGAHWWYGLVLLVAGFLFPIIWGFVGALLEFIESWVAIILAPIACVLMFVYLF